jgi:hypothetical protein
MEFFIPTSPIAIIIATLLVAFVVVRVISDFRGVRQSRQVYEKLLQIGKIHSQQSFTVLIELSRKAETIFSLLDSLYAQNYPTLQVIVVVKPPARAAARVKLAAYKRQHKLSHFKVVDYVKGRTMARLLKRYATGDIVINLHADEKLSPNFFNDLSLDFLNPQVIAVVPDKAHRLDTTISTALHEHYSSLSKIKRALSLSKTVEFSQLNDGVAFRLNAISKNDDTTTLLPSVVSRSAFVTSSVITLTILGFLKKSVKVTKTLLKNMYILWGSLGVFLATVTLLIIFPSEILLLIGVLTLLYMVLYGSVLFQNKVYKFIDRMNLLLLAPFALMYVIFIYIVTLFYVGWLVVTTQVTPRLKYIYPTNLK